MWWTKFVECRLDQQFQRKIKDQFFKNLQSLNDSPYIYIIRDLKTTNDNAYSSRLSGVAPAQKK